MIKNITISGFKSFKEESIELSNLTVLTGLNSSGKSTIIQALRMILMAENGGLPYIKGFGGYNELKSKLSSINDHIELGVKMKTGDSLSLIIKMELLLV